MHIYFLRNGHWVLRIGNPLVVVQNTQEALKRKEEKLYYYTILFHDKPQITVYRFVLHLCSTNIKIGISFCLYSKKTVLVSSHAQNCFRYNFVKKTYHGKTNYISPKHITGVTI